MFNSYKGQLRLFVALAFALVLGGSSAFAQWSTLPGIDGGLQWPATAVLDGKAYVFGGVQGTQVLTTSVSYDLSQGASGSWKLIKSMPNGRYGGFAGVVNGKIYIIGGQSGNSQVAQFTEPTLEYDPVANTYTTKAAMPGPQTMFAGAVVGSKIYIIGGQTLTISGTQAYLSYAGTYVYDVSTDTWSTVVNGNPYPNIGATASVIGTTIYLMGGIDGNLATPAPTTKTYKGTTSAAGINWKPISQMPGATAFAASGVMDGKLYVAGGSPDATSPNANTYALDATANTWSAQYAMPAAAWQQSVLMSYNSALYYVGGLNNSSMYKYVAAAQLPVADAYQTHFAVSLKTGAKKTIPFPLHNAGVVDLTSSLSIPGGTAWVSAAPSSLTVVAGDTNYLDLSFDAGSLAAGNYVVDANLTTNDVNHATIPVKINMFVRDNFVSQATKVVAEEGTGTWCGWCPYGRDSLDALKNQFPDNAILLSYHGPASYSEPLNVQYADNVLNDLGLTGYPNAAIQRWFWPADGAQMVNRGVWAEYARQVLQLQPVAPVAIDVQNFSYDDNTKALSATVNVTTADALLTDASTEYHVTAVVTQDSMEYTQHKYLNGGASATDLSPYYHNDVVRTIYPNDMGAKIDVPANALADVFVTPGAVLTKNISMTVKNVTDATQAHVVFLVHKVVNGKLGDILQAMEMPLVKAAAPVMSVVPDIKAMTIPALDTATYVTTVTNLTDQPLDLLVSRTQNDLPGSDWSSWFCVGSTCYQPDDITGNMTLTPGQAVPVKLYVQGGAYITGKLVGDVTLSFAGASQTSSQKYTTTLKQGSLGVSTAAVAGNGLSIDQNAPNPASGITRLDYFLPTSGSTSIELFSVTGQKVFSKAINGQEHGNHAAMIDVSTLPNGVYTVVLSSNGARVTRSMTVVH